MQLRMKNWIDPPARRYSPRENEYTGRLAGYYERLEKRSNGYFLTRDQIERGNPRMLAQLIQHVPGFTAVRGRGGITAFDCVGSTCWPCMIYGTPMPSGDVDLDSFSPPQSTAASFISGRRRPPRGTVIRVTYRAAGRS